MNKVKEWYTASATTTGRGHIKKRLPCQDKTAESSLPHSSGVFYGIALADGAGSCDFSDKGAKFISKKILEIIKSGFSKIFESEKMSHSLTLLIEDKLRLFSKEQEIDFKELSSTLLFVTIKNDLFILGHIGDGVIGGLKNDGNIEVLSEPENGEFSNSTYFTTSKNHKNRLRVKKGKIKNFIGFILMSDGTAESLYNYKEKKLSKTNIDIINWLTVGSKNIVDEALSNNLSNLIAKKTFDDCSIAIMRQKEK